MEVSKNHKCQCFCFFAKSKNILNEGTEYYKSSAQAVKILLKKGGHKSSETEVKGIE